MYFWVLSQFVFLRFVTIWIKICCHNLIFFSQMIMCKLLGFAPTQFWNKQINCVSKDRSCFPLVNQKSRVIWFDSTGVYIYEVYVNIWQSVRMNYFFSLLKSWISQTQKHILPLASKWNTSARKKSNIFCKSLVCISICTKLNSICTPIDFLSFVTIWDF